MVEQVQVQRPLRLFNVARKVLHKRTTNVLKRNLTAEKKKNIYFYSSTVDEI